MAISRGIEPLLHGWQPCALTIMLTYHGSKDRIRTYNRLLNREPLYRWATVEYWSRWQDLNLRPRASKALTLPTELHLDIGARSRIRTYEGIADCFTDNSRWPLVYPCMWRIGRESNPQGFLQHIGFQDRFRFQSINLSTLAYVQGVEPRYMVLETIALPFKLYVYSGTLCRSVKDHSLDLYIVSPFFR